MRVKSTNDISLEDLRKLGTELGPDFEIVVDESQRFYKSGDAPSWVRFFADADWWIKLLAAYAGLYIAEIVKEAGKDTWKNRSRILSAGIAAGDRVKQFAVALGHLRNRLAQKTRIEIGLPFPDDYDGTSLELVGTSVDELAVQVAVFLHHLPALLDLMRSEGLSRSTVATGLQLLLLPDLSLEVSWQDSSLKKQTRVVRL